MTLVFHGKTLCKGLCDGRQSWNPRDLVGPQGTWNTACTAVLESYGFHCIVEHHSDVWYCRCIPWTGSGRFGVMKQDPKFVCLHSIHVLFLRLSIAQQCILQIVSGGGGVVHATHQCTEWCGRRNVPRFWLAETGGVASQWVCKHLAHLEIPHTEGSVQKDLFCMIDMQIKGF